jgi:hypothetical protein
MKRTRIFALMLLGLVLSACAGSEKFVGELIDVYEAQDRNGKPATQQQMVAAVREALNQGKDRAIGFLGRRDGFLKNAEARIPMPSHLTRVEQGLRKLGQNKIADDFILSLNRAAESAVPLAKKVLADAIRKMTVKDVVNIVRGPDDAATQYFRHVSEPKLRREILPIVAKSTDRMGVTRSYKKLIAQAGPLAAIVDLKSLDLDAYVTQKSLEGLFLFIAKEEKHIRENPVARTTELLRLVFGGD